MERETEEQSGLNGLTLEVEAETGRCACLLDANGRPIHNVKSISATWTYLGLEELVVTLSPINVRYVERTIEE